MRLKKMIPCGAGADLNELEYISALHQTGRNELREDGSIKACDIAAFLMSRHGIQVTKKEVAEKIIGTFGECTPGMENESSIYNEGTSNEQANIHSGSDISPRGCLDLVQILALLFIPLLLKAKQNLDQAQQESNTLKRVWSIQHHSQKGDKLWPDADIIESVLRMMLHDATGDATPRPLTKALIRQLLGFYGEEEASDNEHLLDTMVLAATQDDNADIEGDHVLLDQHRFAYAMTHDVQRYDIDFENRVTTNFHDVFLTGELNEGNFVKTVRTLPCIDYTADTFRSKSYVVVLWVAWILTYFSYLHSEDILTMTELQCNQSEFWCVLAQGVVNWFTLVFQLSVLGTIFTICSSSCNVRNANPLLVVVAICAIVIFILLPFFFDVSVGVFSTEKESYISNKVLYHLSVICGFVLLIDPLLYIFRRLLPAKSLLLAFLEKHMDNTHLEASLKRAASYKLNRLARNACDVHKMAELDGGVGQGRGETRYGIAMLAFAKVSDQKRYLDSFLQTWKQIWNRELFEDEGIWLTTHVLSGNLAQVAVCVLLAAVFTAVYTLELFQTGLDYLDKLVPGHSQRWRMVIPFIFGFVCGEIVIISLITKYIPSSVNTVIQFRRGGFESLKGGYFLKMRFNDSSRLFGSIFWGTFWTSIIIAFVCMILLGICLWPSFAKTAVVLFANIIGICITIMLTMIVFNVLNRLTQSGYYRRYPILSNVVNVIFESWNLALGIGYMTVRGLYLLLAATIFIGRVDVPCLSEDASFVGPLQLDYLPFTFRKDLLAHEAHRHPYIERLGVMYMLRLRHDDFGSRAGTYWRLLFIYALMPWMRKYRNNDRSLIVSEFKFAANRVWTGRMPADSELIGRQSVESSKQEPGAPSELEKLRKENETLRALLFGRGQKSHLTSSCPPAPAPSVGSNNHPKQKACLTGSINSV